MLLSFKETKGKDGIFMVDLIEKNEVVQFKDGNFVLDVNVSSNGETVWLNQKQIASLFGIDRTVVGRHIRNIFKNDELDEKSMCANFAHVICFSNSPSLYILLICRPMTVLSFWNNSPICACVNQTVSFSIFTSSLISPSSVW